MNVTCTVLLCRSIAGRQQWAGVSATLPHAASSVAGVESTGRRCVGRWLPAGGGASGQAAVSRAAPPPAPSVLVPAYAAQGLDAGLGGGGGARPAGLPGSRCARHRHERRLHAAAARAASVRRRQAHDGRAVFKTARRCAAGLVPPGVEPAFRGIQRAVQCRRRRLLQLPGQGV